MYTAMKIKLGLLLMGCLLPATLLQAADFQPLDDIRQAATELAARTITVSGDNSSIKAGHLDPRLRLKRCDQPLTAEPLTRHSNTTNMTVIVSCNGAKPWRVYVPVKVKSYLRVAVSNRPLARGIPVSKDDIIFEQREVNRLTNGYIEDGRMLLGRAPRRSLPTGAVISPKDLNIRKVITKGKRVTIVAESHGLAVRMPGQALQDAGKGEQVRVKNLSSERTVFGTVIGPDLIKVTM